MCFAGCVIFIEIDMNENAFRDEYNAFYYIGRYVFVYIYMTYMSELGYVGSCY